MRAGERNDRIARILAWTGLLLMLISTVWWQFLPRTRTTRETDARSVSGPITRVIIDAGHGGNDSGAMRGVVSEKDLTLDVARRLDRVLREKGMATTLTRTLDETVSLAGRAAVANRESDSVFVSIHFDEGSRAAATGVQTFFATRKIPKTPLVASWLPFLQPVSSAPGNVESESLAGIIQEAIVGRTQAFDRGTRAEQFYVVANVQHPAVLVEGGFLSNDADLARLTTEEYRQQLAEAIADGIMRYRAVVNQPRAALAASAAGAE